MARGRHVEAQRRRWGRWPMLLVVVTMIGATTAVAQTTTASNTYTGCLTPGGDIVNVAIGDTPAKDCKNHQQISWNEEGLQGGPGPEGPEGPKGDKGDPGEPGSMSDLSCIGTKGNTIAGVHDGVLWCADGTAAVENPLLVPNPIKFGGIYFGCTIYGCTYWFYYEGVAEGRAIDATTFSVWRNDTCDGEPYGITREAGNLANLTGSQYDVSVRLGLETYSFVFHYPFGLGDSECIG